MNPIQQQFVSETIVPFFGMAAIFGIPAVLMLPWAIKRDARRKAEAKVAQEAE